MCSEMKFKKGVLKRDLIPNWFILDSKKKKTSYNQRSLKQIMKNSKQMPSSVFPRLRTALALHSYNFLVNKSTLLVLSVASDVSLLYTTMNDRGGWAGEGGYTTPAINLLQTTSSKRARDLCARKSQEPPLGSAKIEGLG